MRNLLVFCGTDGDDRFLIGWDIFWGKNQRVLPRMGLNSVEASMARANRLRHANKCFEHAVENRGDRIMRDDFLQPSAA